MDGEDAAVGVARQPFRRGGGGGVEQDVDVAVLDARHRVDQAVEFAAVQRLAEPAARQREGGGERGGDVGLDQLGVEGLRAHPYRHLQAEQQRLVAADDDLHAGQGVGQQPGLQAGLQRRGEAAAAGRHHHQFDPLALAAAGGQAEGLGLGDGGIAAGQRGEVRQRHRALQRQQRRSGIGAQGVGRFALAAAGGGQRLAHRRHQRMRMHRPGEAGGRQVAGRADALPIDHQYVVAAGGQAAAAAAVAEFDPQRAVFALAYLVVRILRPGVAQAGALRPALAGHAHREVGAYSSRHGRICDEAGIGHVEQEALVVERAVAAAQHLGRLALAVAGSDHVGSDAQRAVSAPRGRRLGQAQPGCGARRADRVDAAGEHAAAVVDQHPAAGTQRRRQAGQRNLCGGERGGVVGGVDEARGFGEMAVDAGAFQVERAAAVVFPAGFGFQPRKRGFGVEADMAQPRPGQAAAARDHRDVAGGELLGLFDHHRFGQLPGAALLQEGVGPPGAWRARRHHQRLRVFQREVVGVGAAVLRVRPGQRHRGIAGQRLGGALAVAGRREVVGIHAFVERQVFARG
ncbi:hypothetical protein CJ010_10210 [Azoarcus sp. DD4]|nr:hypothetical protein CJ010_10210 [Azoarcus sp. DD4]